MRKIIIVDDKPADLKPLILWLCEDIEKLTNGLYAGALLDNVIISESLSDIKNLVGKIKKEGDTIEGILIDFVDETHKVVKAGEILLEQVKSDPNLVNIPIVVYTTAYVREFSPAKLIKMGAHAAFRKEVIGHGAQHLCQQVLDAFNIPYGGGTNSTGPKKKK